MKKLGPFYKVKVYILVTEGIVGSGVVDKNTVYPGRNNDNIS